MKQYCLHGFQGLVELRKTRQGPIVGIYNSDQGGVDEAEEGRWSTVCEGHGVSLLKADAEAHSIPDEPQVDPLPVHTSGFVAVQHAAPAAPPANEPYRKTASRR